MALIPVIEPSARSEFLHNISGHPDPIIRGLVASHPNTSAATLKKLLRTHPDDPAVLMPIIHHPNAPKKLRCTARDLLMSQLKAKERQAEEYVKSLQELE